MKNAARPAAWTACAALGGLSGDGLVDGDREVSVLEEGDAGGDGTLAKAGEDLASEAATVWTGEVRTGRHDDRRRVVAEGRDRDEWTPRTATLDGHVVAFPTPVGDCDAAEASGGPPAREDVVAGLDGEGQRSGSGVALLGDGGDHRSLDLELTSAGAFDASLAVVVADRGVPATGVLDGDREGSTPAVGDATPGEGCCRSNRGSEPAEDRPAVPFRR